MKNANETTNTAKAFDERNVVDLMAITPGPYVGRRRTTNVEEYEGTKKRNQEVNGRNQNGRDREGQRHSDI